MRAQLDHDARNLVENLALAVVAQVIPLESQHTPGYFVHEHERNADEIIWGGVVSVNFRDGNASFPLDIFHGGNLALHLGCWIIVKWKTRQPGCTVVEIQL